MYTQMITLCFYLAPETAIKTSWWWSHGHWLWSFVTIRRHM